MDKNKEEKLKRFINDKVMSEAVYEFLLNAFLSDKTPKDIYVLAASRLSVDFLREGWRKLNNIKDKKEEVGEIESNVGL